MVLLTERFLKMGRLGCFRGSLVLSEEQPGPLGRTVDPRPPAALLLFFFPFVQLPLWVQIKVGSLCTSLVPQSFLFGGKIHVKSTISINK